MQKIALEGVEKQGSSRVAHQMIRDHSTLQKSVFALGAKLHVTPADSPTGVEHFKSQAEKTIAELKALKGKAFDKAYIDNEIAFHEQSQSTQQIQC